MKKNKIALGLLAGSLVAGAIPAAAAPADVTDKDQAKAVDTLTSFEVITGYEDGTFKPENNITRAEFATIAVRLLGLEGAAKLSTGATKFKDVKGDHWASGYINLAVGQGILKGYPDGSFKPEANVTYAESLAILVRLLGYEPAVKGEWPNNYVAQAGALGLTKSVGAVAANVAATRGNIALFADKALSVPKMIQVGYGTDTKFVVSGTDNTDEKTLITENLGLDEYKFDDSNADDPETEAIEDVYQVTATSRTDSDLALNEIEINGDKYVLADSVKVSAVDLLNHYVSFSAKDDTILNIKVESKEVVGNVGADTKADELDIDYVGGDDTYKVADLDNVAGPDFNATSFAGPIRAVIYDNEVIAVDAYNWTDAIVVTDVEVDGTEIEIDGESLQGGSSFTIDTEEDVYFNGQTIKTDDIKAGDLVYINDNENGSDRVFVKVVKPAVSGTVESFDSGLDDITVDGKKYDLTTTARVSTDGDDTSAVRATTNLEDLLDQEVNVYLDAEGDAIYVTANVDGELENSETLVFLEVEDDTARTPKVYFLNSQGDVVNYKWDSTDVVNEDGDELDGQGGRLNANAANELNGTIANSPVKIKVDDNGNLDKIEVQDTTTFAGLDNVDGIDEDTKLVDLDGAKYRIDKDTLIFDTFDEEVVSADAFLGLNVPNDVEINVSYAILDGRTVDVLVVNAQDADVDNDTNLREDAADVVDVKLADLGASTDSDNTFAVTGIRSLSGDLKKVTVVDKEGNEQEFTADEDDVNGLSVGDVAELKFGSDNVITDFAVQNADEADVTLDSGDFDKDDKFITTATDGYLSDNVVVLDATDDYAIMSLSDLEDYADENDFVVDLYHYNYNDDKLVDFVIVKDINVEAVTVTDGDQAATLAVGFGEEMDSVTVTAKTGLATNPTVSLADDGESATFTIAGAANGNTFTFEVEDVNGNTATYVATYTAATTSWAIALQP